jgi:two-component system KDP operon response regulator KdpE
LLALFAKNEGKVLTHQYLLRAIWGPGFINQSQYLRVFIAQIRKKLKLIPTDLNIFLQNQELGIASSVNKINSHY